MLDIIRVYVKILRQKPDFNDAIILKRRSTLEIATAEAYNNFAQRLKYGRIWSSGKHDGVMVKRDYILQDGAGIELHI